MFFFRSSLEIGRDTVEFIREGTVYPIYGRDALENKVRIENAQNYLINPESNIPFDSVIVYPISKADSKLDNPEIVEGLRIFYKFRAGKYLDETLSYPFMAILTSKKQYSPKGIVNYTYLRDNSFVSDFVEEQEDGLLKMKNDGFYFIDAQLIHLGGLEPIDPSEVEVLDICTIESDNEKYDVTINLEVCNITDNKAKGLNLLFSNEVIGVDTEVEIEPIGGASIILIDELDGKEGQNCSICLYEYSRSFPEYEKADLVYCIKDTMPIDRPGFQLEDSCVNIRVKMKVSKRFIGRLHEDTSILKVCSILHYNRDSCLVQEYCKNISLLDIIKIEQKGMIGSLIDFYLLRGNFKDNFIWLSKNQTCAEGRIPSSERIPTIYYVIVILTIIILILVAFLMYRIVIIPVFSLLKAIYRFIRDEAA